MIDHKKLRECIAEATPEDNLSAMTALVQSAGEMAKELRITLPKWLEACALAWSEAHGKDLTHCEIVEDGAGKHEAVVAVRTRWTVQ
jgi:hypothetical protein